MADTPQYATLEEYEKALHDEWNTYVATRTIDINGARAFNAGDPVPVSHVEGNVVPSDAVAKASTKAGQKAIEGVVQ